MVLFVAHAVAATCSGTLTLQSIAITPGNPTVPVGTSLQLTATGTYRCSKGGTATANITTTVGWSSGNTSVATVSASGLATVLASAAVGLSSTIRARLSGITGSTVVSAGPAVLKSIAVTPSSATVVIGQTQQFKATGTYSNGRTADLTTQVVWASSNTAVATISSGGLASALAVGASTISAKLGSVGGSAAMTVTAPQLVKVSVTPASVAIAKGLTQQFSAVGTYSDGSQRALSSASWSSSNQAVATVNSSGLATGAGVGTATITATSGGISGTASLTVNTAQVVSLAVTPASPSIAKGSTQQFAATATYTDGSTKDLSGTVSWTSSNTTVASISSTGLARALDTGTTTIQATDSTSGVQGSAVLTVGSAPVSSVVVTPVAQSIPLGSTQQFTATAKLTDGTTQDVTTSATWQSSSTAVATVSQASGTQGLSKAVGEGSTQISATMANGVSGSTTLTVTSAALVSVDVSPSSSSIPLGTQEQFKATGTYTDGTTRDLSSQATWSSSDATIATVSASGLATSVGIGAVTITAVSGSVQGTASLTIAAAALDSISVTPSTAQISAGSTQQFKAMGQYSDGTSKDITSSVHWTTSDAAVATISVSSGSEGLASGVSPGTVTITASSASVQGTAQLTVAAAALTSIDVAPASPTIALGLTQQFTATGTYSDGSHQDLTALANWSSSVIAVAVVSNSSGSHGLATSAGTGQTTISATYNGVTGGTSLSVGSAQLLSLAVTPQGASVAAGNTLQMTATGTFTNGVQDVSQYSTWTTSDSTIATVDAKGLVRALAQGSATITATDGNASDQATITVTAATLQSIAITPATASITVGSTQQFVANGTYSDGSTGPVAGVLWSSSSGAATVSSSGIATGVAVGTAVITATSGSMSSNASLTVNAAVVLPSGATIPANYFGMHIQCADAIYSGPNPNASNATNRNYNPDCGTSIVPWPSVSTAPNASSPFGVYRMWNNKVKFGEIATSSTVDNWFWPTFDHWVLEARAHNAELVYTAGSNVPSWACASGTGNGCVPTDSAWTTFLNAIFTRSLDTSTGAACTSGSTCRPVACQSSGNWAGDLRGCISTLEVWNEPNTSASFAGTLPQLVHLTSLARQTRDAVAGINVRISTPAYTYTGNAISPTGACATANGGHFSAASNTPEAYLCAYLSTTSSVASEGRGADNVDVIGFHLYPAVNALASIAEATVNSRINGIKNAMSDNGIPLCAHGTSTGSGGCKEMLITEFSWGAVGNGSSTTNELGSGTCALTSGCPRIFPANDSSSTSPQSTGDLSVAYPGYGFWASDQSAFLMKTFILGWSGGASKAIWFWWGAADPANAWGVIYCLKTYSPLGCAAPTTLQPAGKAFGVVQSWLMGAVMNPCSVTGSLYTCDLKLANGNAARIVWDSSKGPGQSGSYSFSGYNKVTDMYGNSSTSISSPVQIGYAPVLLEQVQ